MDLKALKLELQELITLLDDEVRLHNFQTCAEVIDAGNVPR